MNRPPASSYFDRVEDAAAWLRVRIGAVPDAAVVLGSGLGAFAESLEAPVAFRYEDIPHWPPSRVRGHAGRVVVGTVAGRRVLALSGRVHAYEGHEAGALVFGVRVLGRLGIEILVLTNAAGGINPGLTAGTLMVLDDHINFTGTNPLVGPNDERFGPRFPDMTDVYSRRLRATVDEAALAAGLSVAHGVYLAVTGPSFETPAEIRAFRALGADAVGMSTVLEAIAARHLGLQVLGLSCISNAAAGLGGEPLTEDDVVATVGRVHAEFAALLEAVLVRL